MENTVTENVVSEKMPEQNGMRMPGPGTITRKLWDLATKLSNENKRTIAISEFMEVAQPMGFKVATIKSQYAYWRKFYGITGRVTCPKAEAKKAEAAQLKIDNAAKKQADRENAKQLKIAAKEEKAKLKTEKAEAAAKAKAEKAEAKRVADEQKAKAKQEKAEAKKKEAEEKAKLKAQAATKKAEGVQK